MPLEANSVVAFLYCSIHLWRWHFYFIKQHLVQSFGLRHYDSEKCYVYKLNATNSLIVGLLLNLIIFSLYGLVGLCTKIYLSFFLITYVLRVVHTGSFDLLVFVLIILCLFCAKDYIIPSQWVKCIIIILSVFLLGQVYCNFLLQTQWRTISYFKLQYIAEKNWTMSHCDPKKNNNEYTELKTYDF